MGDQSQCSGIRRIWSSDQSDSRLAQFSPRPHHPNSLTRLRHRRPTGSPELIRTAPPTRQRTSMNLLLTRDSWSDRFVSLAEFPRKANWAMSHRRKNNRPLR
jgi:hypothetical protein